MVVYDENMTLNGKEKIWFLINRLIGGHEITPKGRPIGLHLADDLATNYSPQDLIDLLKKLEDDKVAKLVGLPTDQNYHKYQVELLPDFDSYVIGLTRDPGYLEWSGKKPSQHVGHSLNNQIDLTKSKEENADRYLSAANAQELLRMSDERRKEVMDYALTTAQQIELQQSRKVISDALKHWDSVAKIDVVASNLVPSLITPPNYEAEQSATLRRIERNLQAKPVTVQNNQREYHEISYTGSRQIIFDDFIELGHPGFDGENDRVFTFLYQHPDEKFTIQQVREATRLNLQKSFHKIVENLGFRGDLIKMFFDISATDIRFRKRITTEECRAMGAHPIRLNRRARKN
jgi:hypothetical protein